VLFNIDSIMIGIICEVEKHHLFKSTVLTGSRKYLFSNLLFTTIEDIGKTEFESLFSVSSFRSYSLSDASLLKII